jgi:hypothetical protein
VTTVDKPLAWHGSAELKADAIARMKAHREADTLIRGCYLITDPEAARGYQGCFHGCLTAEVLAAEQGVPAADVIISDDEWWKEAERLFGIPYSLAELLDDAFEAFDDRSGAGVWAVEVTEAIPVGADLNDVIRLYWDTPGVEDETNAALLVRLIAAAPIPGAAR